MVEVLLTVDVECSMGGAWDHPEFQPVPPDRAILGKIGSQYYGTPLIMDILEEHGLQGTFFIEVLAAPVVPRSQLTEAYGEIARRGHDAQLHIHPVYDYYWQFQQGKIRKDQLPANMDLIGALPPERQAELLRQGTELFREFVGKDPVAFRAGSFGAGASTIQTLVELGFAYDSSFNGSYLKRSCLMRESKPTNVPWREGPLWEVPITNFETGGWGMRGLKPLDVGAVSMMEMRRVLEEAERTGLSTAVFLMHSFTLYKRTDIQFRNLRPDRLVIRRFRALCKFLQENSRRFKVTTFSQQPSLASASQDIPFPNLGSIVPFCRKVVQGVNRAYWI